jgi:hypothetical protein
LAALRHILILTSAQFAGYQKRTRTNPRHLRKEACFTSDREVNIDAIVILTAFQPRINEEQRELGEQYHQLTLPTAHKNFVKEFAMQYTQLT